MAKKLCKKDIEIVNIEKKPKYYCKKCGLKSVKEKHCCNPKKLKKSA
jgi:hypothetical protein